MAIVVASGLGKRYGDRWAVRELELEIEPGETFALIGPSGCGKTTTLRMLNRLIDPSAGRLELFGSDALGADRTELRRRIGYVIQEVGLFPHWNVRQNVGVVPELLGWPDDEISARSEQLLELFGLPAAEFAERHPHELSGGQRQRVGIARALCADPPLVLLDEPFGALDPITRESIQEEFASLRRRLEQTFVLVTHDIFEAVRLADRIGVMADGRLIRVATPAELVRDPGSEIVEGLLGRHRFQLALMTRRLGELAEKRAHASAASEYPALAAGADESLWSVLDRLAASDHDHVSVEIDGRRHVISRAELLSESHDGR